MKLTNVVIIGVGLIGASIGIDLKKKKLCHKVYGIGRTKKNLVTAIEKNAIDEIIDFNDIEAICPELVILATPVWKTAEYLNQLSSLNCSPIIMDVASSKNKIFQYKTDKLISVHPMAGSEKRGAAFARSGLFENQPLIIITDNTNAELISFARELWLELGSNILELSLDEHNRLLALVSHLPHLLSYIMGAWVDEQDAQKIAKIAGPGFFSFIRLGLSSPELWEEILVDNRIEIIRFVDRYLDELSTLRKLLLNNQEDFGEKLKQYHLGLRRIDEKRKNNK